MHSFFVILSGNARSVCSMPHVDNYGRFSDNNVFKHGSWKSIHRKFLFAVRFIWYVWCIW